MATLANNILDMARLDTGAITLKRDWCPVEEIVGSVLTRLAARLAARPVEVRVARSIPLVKLDAVMIEQVLVNLIENALKYTPAGSPLELGAEATASTVTIWVADRGPGIAGGPGGAALREIPSRRGGARAKRRRAGPRHMPRGGRGPRRLDLGGQPPRGRRRVPVLAASR